MRFTDSGTKVDDCKRCKNVKQIALHRAKGGLSVFYREEAASVGRAWQQDGKPHAFSPVFCVYFSIMELDDFFRDE
ncbi:hypothetical protein BAG01nite_37610 [Brevibacillus agri]|uniref:Uncharacterized protein n=1 Tax=Brevibacillus agri TaxID=51101 RepID=A0ABQ0SYF9_9BACL|nr:hypothetical protein BAG01nite_37610 [Brevibacillus agri]